MQKIVTNKVLIFLNGYEKSSKTSKSLYFRFLDLSIKHIIPKDFCISGDFSLLIKNKPKVNRMEFYQDRECYELMLYSIYSF